jgi:hypothetical protein
MLKIACNYRHKLGSKNYAILKIHNKMAANLTTIKVKGCERYQRLETKHYKTSGPVSKNNLKHNNGPNFQYTSLCMFAGS